MTTNERIPYLTEDQLSGLGITTHDVIESIEALIARAANQTAWSAPKAVILPPDGRYLMAALAAVDEPPLLATKSVVLNPSNPDRGLPQINGVVTLLDSSSGLPVAILDGKWITAVRTAGLSATAAKYMATKDSSVAAFVGCGVQAQSHLQAFCRPFSAHGSTVVWPGAIQHRSPLRKRVRSESVNGSLWLWRGSSEGCRSHH